MNRFHERMVSMVQESITLMANVNPTPEEAEKDLWRAYHDLWCFHVGIIVGDRHLFNEVAQLATYATEDKAGNASERAWSGVWKFAILGDWSRAQAQFEIMYRAHKPLGLRLPRQVLLRAWLEQDWKAFNRALLKTYQHLWKCAHRWKKITQETDTAVEIDLRVFNTPMDGSWQEIAFCLEAVRKGIEVTFDPLFFPPTMMEYSQLAARVRTATEN